MAESKKLHRGAADGFKYVQDEDDEGSNTMRQAQTLMNATREDYGERRNSSGDETSSLNNSFSKLPRGLSATDKKHYILLFLATLALVIVNI